MNTLDYKKAHFGIRYLPLVRKAENKLIQFLVIARSAPEAPRHEEFQRRIALLEKTLRRCVGDHSVEHAHGAAENEMAERACRSFPGHCRGHMITD